MPNIPVTKVPGVIPQGLCFATDQERLTWFVENGFTAFISSAYTGVIVQAAVPTADERGYVWYQVDGNNSYIGEWIWSNATGGWVRPNPVGPNSSERRIWVGTTVDLETYDGGAAGVVSSSTGPMWEVDTDFAMRSPMGVGTFASGVALNITGTAGEQTHIQTIPELAAHSHGATDIAFSFVASGGDYCSGGGNAFTIKKGPAGAAITQEVGTSQPMNVVHPVIGVYFIKRTGRIYYTP